MSESRSARQLAERLDDMEMRLNARPAAAAHTTIVNGAIDQMETYDTGQRDQFGNIIWGTRLVSRIGRQADGTNTVKVIDGPTPPAPAGLTVVPGPGTLTVKWDGTFKDGAAMPEDFYAVIVHLAKSSVLNSVVLPSPATVGGSVVAKDGDGLTIGGLDHVEYTVILVTVAQSGKQSDPSKPVVATPDDGSSLRAVTEMQAQVAEAVTKAQNAEALADGKAATYFTPTAPDPASIVLSVGDLWFDTDDGNKLYRYSGTAWVVAQDQSAAQALSTAQAADSKAQTAIDGKITTYAQTAQPAVNTSRTGDLWLDTDDGNRLYRFNGTTWVSVRDATIVSAKQSADQALSLATIKGKTYSQSSAPDSSSTPPPVAGDLWWDTVNYVLRQYNGSSWGAVTMDASQNIRSNTITAGLLATQIVLASTIIAGPLDNSHAEISSDGISLYQRVQDGSNVMMTRSSRLGSSSGDDFLQVFSRTDGQVVASIDQAGVITGAKARLGRAPGDTFINGIPFEAYFTPQGNGLVDYGVRDTTGTATSGTGSESKWLEVQTVLQPNRLYRIQLTPTAVRAVSSGGATAVLVLRAAYGGQPVTVSTSYQLQSATMLLSGTEFLTGPSLTAILNTATALPNTTTQLSGPTEYRFLVSYISIAGAQIALRGEAALPSILTIEDIGPSKQQVGINHGNTAPPATKQNYTTWWRASASVSYRGDGSRRDDIGTEMVHGQDPSGWNGNGCAMAVFWQGAYTSTNPSENGKLPTTAAGGAFAGAKITAVDFMLHPHHWYYNSGGTVYYLPSNYYTSLPSTFTNSGSNYYSSAGFAIGESKYVPARAEPACSLIIGQPPSTSLAYYGRFDGSSYNDAPVMRVSYTR